jgi:hypothetical protein
MSKEERKERVRQFFRRWKDWWTLPDFRLYSMSMEPREGAFPVIPSREDAPEELKSALRFDSDRILAGSTTVFKQISLKVERHPAWQKDYLAGVDVETIKSSTHLNHRKLPNGADVKLIWEVSRWGQLVRLAQEAYILNDRWSMKLAIRQVYNWVRNNSTMNGYNWTSALEGGLRLINYCWIDALTLATASNKRLGDISEEVGNSLAKLRKLVLPAHVWFVWRYKSFGSSANNHLLGELSGLICALSRWPQMEKWAAPLDQIQSLWEAEVLKQFAPDGGNREQALNYHLFSFELCWQSYLALTQTGRTVSPEVYERLQRAADYFVIVQARKEPWDYGDSDDAYVTPFWERENEIPEEWVKWMESPDNHTCIKFWLGEPPPIAAEGKPSCEEMGNGWLHFPETGMAVCWQKIWMARWDLSSLGYLETAAHGHLDALHFSLWYKEMAFIIDPGTGAYYGDLRAREYLTSWQAHNGPHLQGISYPERRGPFLWSECHEKPRFQKKTDLCMEGTLKLPAGTVSRQVIMVPEKNTWLVEDYFEPIAGGVVASLETCWQFAPECKVEKLNERSFKLIRTEGAVLLITVGENWKEVNLFIPKKYEHFHSAPEDLNGLCSPSFRTLRRGPRLVLSGPLTTKLSIHIQGE